MGVCHHSHHSFLPRFRTRTKSLEGSNHPPNSQWILGKIRFSNLILAHCKTHAGEYEVSFRASLRQLTGLHKSCPNSVFYDASGFHPLFYERHTRARASAERLVALNCSHPLARIFSDYIESDFVLLEDSLEVNEVYWTRIIRSSARSRPPQL